MKPRGDCLGEENSKLSRVKDCNQYFKRVLKVYSEFLKTLYHQFLMQLQPK
jgi:hypothetical protein